VDNGIKIVCGSGTGAFTGTVQRLQPGTKYYLRSYAISGEGTSYGSEVTFLTIEGELKQLVGMSYLGTGEVIPELQSNDSGWHYFAFTKGANGDGKIYIDGVLASEGSFDNERYFYSSLFLGAGYSSEWSGFYKGWLDELRVSNIVRSPESIREHYYSNRAFSCDANTFGLFHFNEGEGSVIKPVVGNAGRLYNGVEFTRGKFSYALYFDGLDDKGDCNMNIPENNITIEFWAKPDGIQDATIIQPFGFYNSNIFLKAVVGN